jgi:NAD(P)-dependent dehydrogenase (short-subunit alcohol dehydrogenase family)
VAKAGTHDLTGAVGVVTGGNGGIGLALALELAHAGSAVVIWGRNKAKNSTALARLAETGRPCAAVECDISEESQVIEAFARTVAEFGKVDSFFANAAVPGQAVPFVDMTYAQWREVLDINLDGSFFCLREAARHMVHRGQGGALTVVSSIMTFYGGTQKEHYAVTKSGNEALARALAVELAPHQIRVNCLVPGWTDTELTTPGSGFIAEENYTNVREYTRRRTPVLRWGAPEEIGAVAPFLADPSLTFHTGDSVVVDGGYTKF